MTPEPQVVMMGCARSRPAAAKRASSSACGFSRPLGDEVQRRQADGARHVAAAGAGAGFGVAAGEAAGRARVGDLAARGDRGFDVGEDCDQCRLETRGEDRGVRG